MALEDDIAKIKELNEEIEALSKKLREPSKIFEEGEINQAKLYIKSLRTELLKVDSDLNYIADSFKRSVQELSKQNTFLNQGKKSLKAISDISSQLLRIKYGEVDASSKDLSKLITKAKIKEDELIQSINLLKTSEKQTTEIKAQIGELTKAAKAMEAFRSGAADVLDIQEKIEGDKGVKLFSGLEDITNAIPGLNKFTGAFKEASKAAKDAARQNSLEKELVDAQNKESDKKFSVLEKQRITDLESLKSGKGLTKEKIKRLGLEKKLVGTSKAGKPVDLSGTAAAKKAKSLGATDMVKPLGSAKKLTATTINPLKAGLKSLGPILKTALGPLALLAMLVQTLLEADKATADLAKGMNLTYQEANATRGEFTAIANASGDIFVTTKGIQESFSFINSQLGSNTKLSGELLTQFTKLREASGLTNEELYGATQLQLTSNKTLNQITGAILAQSKITAASNGVALNSKEILKEIKDVSAATTLSLGKNPSAIADAVTQAKALGMSLGQVEKIAEGLLNFESSITSELKAELLLGKNINLEQARLFALNNNIAGVAKEISSQIGNSADFARMNVLQQKALAEAVGMSREELAKTLFVQENLGAATGDEAIKRKKILQDLESEFGIEGAKLKLQEESIENLENQAGIQDRFNQSVLKLKELFVSLSEPIFAVLDGLMPILELLGSVVGFIGSMISGITAFTSMVGEAIGFIGSLAEGLGPVNYLLKGIAAVGIVAAAYAAYLSLGWIPVVGPVLGAAAAAGTLSAGFGALNKADDMMSGAPGYGKRALYDEGELTLLNNNDTVVAGTDLFKPALANDMISGSPQIIENTTIQPINQSQNTSMEVSQLKEENAAIKQESRKTNSLLENLISATKSNKNIQMEDAFAPLYS